MLFVTAQRLYAENKLREAEAILVTIPPTDASYPYALIHLGAIYLGEKNWPKGEKCFSDAYAHPSLKSMPYLVAAFQGQGYYNGGKFDKAIESYANACRLSNNSPVYVQSLQIARTRYRETISDKQHLREKFDAFAPYYKNAQANWGNTQPQECAYAISKFFASSDSARQLEILDLCCGVGQVGQFLRESLVGTKISITGVDLSPKSTALAKNTGAYDHLAVGDAEAYMRNIGKDRFDLIIAVDSIYFFPEFNQLATDVARGLRDGGYFCFNTIAIDEDCPSKTEVIGDIPFTFHSRTKLIRDTEAAGLRPVEIQEREQFIFADKPKLPGFIFVFRNP